MQPIAAYQHLCALVVIVLAICMAFLLLTWPQGRHMTFSQHAAQHRAATIYYFCVFALLLPLLSLFFVGWFAPTFHLPLAFTIFIVLAMVLQLSIAIVPEVGGWKTTFHVVGAAASGFSMLFALLVALFTGTIGDISKAVMLVSIIIMSGVLYVGAKNKITHPNLLVLQGSYYVAFFVAVLVTTYLG